MNAPPADNQKPIKQLPWSLAPLPEDDESLSETEAAQMTQLRNQAMRWLARREYAAQELIQRLAEDAPRPLAEKVVHGLRAAGLQSDARYVAAKIQAQSKKFGWPRIARALKQAGIEEALIRDAKRQCDEQGEEGEHGEDRVPSEVARALAVLQKKSKHPPIDVKAKSSLIRFMQGRGFSWEVIQQAMQAQKHGEAID